MVHRKKEDPHPALSRKRERGKRNAGAPLLPLAGEGWDEGLAAFEPHAAHPFFSTHAWHEPFARSRTRPI
jgi:hypothetical protein